MLRSRAGSFAFCILAGCQVIGGFKTFDTNAAPLPPCRASADAGVHGPKMVQVQNPDGTCFFIDSTEVARKDYDVFLASKLNVASQSSVCSWNTDFTTTACEQAAAGQAAGDAGSPVDTSLPVVCVNFCDAQAFCTWAGKSLCHGDFGGATQSNADLSQWYSACSNGGVDVYPYGSDYDPTACNGDDRPGTGCSGGSCSLVPAAQLQSCSNQKEGGPLNMSGNAAEIVDECDEQVGKDDNCYVRGGGVNSPGAGLECSAAVEQARNAAKPFVGFRCCL